MEREWVEVRRIGFLVGEGGGGAGRCGAVRAVPLVKNRDSGL